MRIATVVAAASLSLLFGSVQAPAREHRRECSSRDISIQVRTFIRAYNVGDLRKLDSLFAPSGRFGLYRVSLEREWPDSENRESLVEYFGKRHEMQDDIQLVELRISKRPVDDEGRWGFTFWLRRTSADPMPLADGPYDGKGGADCTYIYAWNMSRL